MPIKVPDNLPAIERLNKERIFAMGESRAFHQDIRPLKIAILNLMPLKEVTEVQLLRLLGNTPLQIEITLLHPASHHSKNTASEHLQSFYHTFDEIKNDKFDGMIITGAPIELLEFEEVNFWKELTEIMEWTKSNVTSTYHICWGAQAGLYYHYGIDKHLMDNKMFGVFNHKIDDKNSKIMFGFNDGFKALHSRHTTVYKKDIEKIPELEVVAESDKAGVFIVEDSAKNQLFVTGHLEYAADTLDKEYKRDLSKGLKIEMPENYYMDNNPAEGPVFSWKDNGDRIYSNWINYYVGK